MGRWKIKICSFLAVLALFLATSAPASAANLYFTGLNDTVAPLTSDSMPFWSGGTLYVPYTVFDSSRNEVGISLGLVTSYNRTNQTVTFYNLRQILTFDLSTGNCRDELGGAVYSSRAIMRNNKPYVALNMVCSFFGLEWSYHQLPYIPQGYLVRIKNADVVLDDGSFIENARDLINNRLRDYTQSLSSAETTDPAPVQPSPPPEVDSSSTAAYLAFRCESGQGLSGILDALDRAGHYGAFFLSPQVLEEEGDLVRRILGTGHSVGILAEGEEVRPLLEQGSLALERAAQTRTTLAYVPAGQRAALEQEGWVCWRETLSLAPSGTVGPNTFANSVLDRLGDRRRTVYLTLEGGTDTARVLSTLLRRLGDSRYSIAVPMETRL